MTRQLNEDDFDDEVRDDDFPKGDDRYEPLMGDTFGQGGRKWAQTGSRARSNMSDEDSDDDIDDEDDRQTPLTDIFR